jgi:hypothetical protein
MTFESYESLGQKYELTFNRHQSFYFREGWLRKGINAISLDPAFFLNKDADQILGLGKNMVASLRYWLVATGMTEEIKEKNRMIQIITPIGKMIMEMDPYFELNGTLWIVHALLSSNIQVASTWYWFFNRYAKPVFNREDFIQNLERWILANGKTISIDSLGRDFECFTRTYLSSEGTPEDILVCPLGNLNLLEQNEDKSQSIIAGTKRGRLYRLKKPEIKNIEPLVVGWVLANWRKLFQPNTFQVSFFDALREDRSPGRLFNLSAALLIEISNRLKEQHPDLSFKVTTRDRLDVIELPNIEPEEYIVRYYKMEG